MQRFGRYEVTEELGTGAMGAVYKAVDPTMGRDVAIKTIVPHVVSGPQAAEFRDRFFKEARAAGRLSHPGIVTIYDFAEQDGIPFLVMEYVQGRTLQSLLESERLPLDRAFDIGIQLSEALDYAHRNGVIHRDIKPANILVTADGRAKIADFGIAKLNDSQLTTTGQVLGTPAYMAPELFTAEQIDGRADLFSVGIVLYWMTTGDKPFSGESIMAVQYKVMHTDPVPPRKLNPLVSRDLEAVILKALAKDRNERYPFGAELAHDLRELRAGHPVSVTHPTADSPAKTVEMTAVLTSEPSSRRQARIIVPKPRPERVRNRRSRPRSIWRTGLTVIFIVLMVSVVRFLNKTPDLPEPAGVGPLAPALPAPLAQQPPVPLPSDPTRKGSLQTLETISLELTAKQQSGAVFRAEGQPDQSLAMKPGDSVTLHARGSAVLILSSRSALQGKLNGKPISFGEGDGGGEFQITPLGVEDRISLPRGFPPGLFGVPGDVERESKDGGISSPRRQKELAQSPSSVRLIITSPGIPENVALIVRMDDVLLYRRAGTNAPASVLEQGSKRLQLLPGGPIAPFTEERFLPPGHHKLRVSVQLGAGRLGETEEVMGEFEAGQRRTLSIQFGRGAGNRFRITLD